MLDWRVKILTFCRNGTFSGGNRFTTYTAIPSYVSTSGSVFYLTIESTALTFFDFTQPETVTIRYDATTVTGAFLRATDMFEAVERLTEYTGRMPTLPEWVDDGAILGIQGGQAKVNSIVKQGLELRCPIAGVWLQDWCGTRKYHSGCEPAVADYVLFRLSDRSIHQHFKAVVELGE
jgi:alpha-glucosidase (family GH31 glycosyl hydrolase)